MSVVEYGCRAGCITLCGCIVVCISRQRDEGDPCAGFLCAFYAEYSGCEYERTAMQMRMHTFCAGEGMGGHGTVGRVRRDVEEIPHRAAVAGIRKFVSSMNDHITRMRRDEYVRMG